MKNSLTTQREAELAAEVNLEKKHSINDQRNRRRINPKVRMVEVKK
jgi:hypothetical protein